MGEGDINNRPRKGEMAGKKRGRVSLDCADKSRVEVGSGSGSG